MTSLTLILAILLCVAVVVITSERIRQAQARRDREIVRRIHRYLSSLPPARPW